MHMLYDIINMRCKYETHFDGLDDGDHAYCLYQVSPNTEKPLLLRSIVNSLIVEMLSVG